MKIDISCPRHKCVFSYNEDLENIYTLKNFPIFMGTTDKPISDDLFHDMNFQISKSSGLVQLNPIVNLELIYEFSHNPGTIGKTWARHHSEFADYIKKYNNKKVLEIGGLSGILANKCLDSFDYDWTIIDPNVEINDHRIKTYKSFFDDSFNTNENYDLIVHSHLIEHITNIDSFFSKCNSLLKDDGMMIFSFPNFDQHMKNFYLNSINFEHTIQLNEYFMDCFLKRNKFEIIEKKYMEEFTSIFYTTKKSKEKIEIFENQYETQKKNLKNYFDTVNNFINIINKNYIDNETIYLFGGHVTSQFLIKLGLNENMIKNVLDNDPSKQHKRLYGTKLIVENPNIIKEDKEPVVILKVSFFDSEIKNQLLKINPNTKILTI